MRKYERYGKEEEKYPYCFVVCREGAEREEEEERGETGNRSGVVGGYGFLSLSVSLLFVFFCGISLHNDFLSLSLLSFRCPSITLKCLFVSRDWRSLSF